LRLFVATRKQENELATSLLQVNPVSRPEIDAKFADAFANRLDISKVTERKPANAYLDSRSRLPVPEFSQPVREIVRLSDFNLM
jgi:hypothetical protein